jgi:hypothetical protein
MSMGTPTTISIMGFYIINLIFPIVSSIDSAYNDNKRIDSEILNEIPNLGMNMCAVECLSYHDCLSVNYNTENFICQLNTEDSSVVSATNYRYATRSELANAKVGKCVIIVKFHGNIVSMKFHGNMSFLFFK